MSFSEPLIPDNLKVTEKEYLDLSFHFLEKLELTEGTIRTKSTTSPSHNRIATNLTGYLWNALEKCSVNGSDQRVALETSSNFFYPDLSIVCEAPVYDPRDPYSLLNPVTLFEILSDSTYSYDFGAKFLLYQQIPSLKEYILVSQDSPSIFQYRKNNSGFWYRQTSVGLDQTLSLLPENVSVPLSVIYQDLAL